MANFSINFQKKLNELLSLIKTEKSSAFIESINLAESIFNEINKHFTNDKLIFLEKLIVSSIVIKTYPKRIIKKGTGKQTGTQFDAALFCLLNSKLVRFSGTEIKPYMCYQHKEDRQILSNKIEFDDTKNLWKIKNMKWQSVEGQRSSRGSTCDKYIISFEFGGLCYCSSNSFRIDKTLNSDTLVIVVHSKQEVDALMTLFWDDYYRVESDVISSRSPFLCHDHSSFKQLVDNLSCFFFRETNRYLTENNQQYLLQKIRDLFPTSSTIHLEDFMKFQMPQSKLSFGQWIMAIIKMLKISILDKMWKNGLIEGFISKNVQNVFQDCIPGTFLLRFSERHAAIGVITLSDNNVIEPWDPYTYKHLRQYNFANLLNDYPQLKYLKMSDGTVINRIDALSPYTDSVTIDDGYTERGTVFSPFDDHSSIITSETYDCNFLLSSFDFNEPNDNCTNNNAYCDLEETNFDLTEILHGCETLLKNYDSLTE